MQQTPETATRGPPEPHIDEEGNRLFNFRQTAKICGVSPQTVSNWATQGMAGRAVEFDFKLKCVPVIHHRRSSQTPRSFMQTRLLIPEDRVYALKEMLDDCPRRPGPISRADIGTLEAAARRSRLPSSHIQNSFSP